MLIKFHDIIAELVYCLKFSGFPRTVTVGYQMYSPAVVQRAAMGLLDRGDFDVGSDLNCWIYICWRDG